MKLSKYMVSHFIQPQGSWFFEATLPDGRLLEFTAKYDKVRNYHTGTDADYDYAANVCIDDMCVYSQYGRIDMDIEELKYWDDNQKDWFDTIKPCEY